MIQPPPPKRKHANVTLSPALQFFWFVLLFIGVFFVGNIIGLLISTGVYGQGVMTAIASQNFKSANVVNSLWIIQLAGTSLPILIAPIIFGWVVVRRPVEYLWTNTKFPFMLMAVVLCVMFISSPLIEWLSNINEKMVLPNFLSGVQKWMRDAEDQTRAAEEVMFNMPTTLSMIKNVLFVGLFTAIAEEFMFRGVIQTILIQWTKNKHIAVWITAILFSAFHMQFFGFLPRLFLGVIFGYFVVWSGSIWPAVWAHFINNSTAIVVTWLFQHKKIGVNPDDEHVFNNALYISSLIVVLFLMFLYQYLGRKQPQILNGEELD